MGFPMAGHLVKAGHEVTVFNRNPARAQAWLEAFTGKSVATPREVGAACDVVMLCVGNDNDVLFGEISEHTVTSLNVVINNVFKPLVDRLEPADWGVCEEE